MTRLQLGYLFGAGALAASWAWGRWQLRRPARR